MLFRVITGVGLFALGYYLGKEVGRTESVRSELEAARGEDDAGTPPQPDESAKGEDAVT